MPVNTDLIPTQFDLTANATTDVYTCPDRRAARIVLHLCNRSATETAFRVSRAIQGAAAHNKQFYYYDATLKPRNALRLDPITLNQGDVLRVFVPTGAAVTCQVEISDLPLLT